MRRLAPTFQLVACVRSVASSFPLLLKAAIFSHFDCHSRRKRRGQEATDRIVDGQQMQPYSFAASVGRDSLVPPRTRVPALASSKGSAISKGSGIQQLQTSGSESSSKRKLVSSFPMLTGQAVVVVRGQGSSMPVRDHSSAALHCMHTALPCGLQLTDLHLPLQSRLPSALDKATASFATTVSNLHPTAAGLFAPWQKSIILRSKTTAKNLEATPMAV